ncbi:MAG: fumarate hydratase [Treponema sp.]|jgi:fumarate hydratase class I|nr:fumarate hydratase [Treponema sp.]
MDFRSVIEKTFWKISFKTLDSGLPAPELRGGRLFVPPQLLGRISREAFRALSFYLRESHLELLAGRFRDPELSANDRLVIGALLENALVAARGELALCQDTGTAAVYAWKDESVYTGADDRTELEAGIARAYEENHLRASQVGASSFFEEFNTADNLPAQIHIEASPDGALRRAGTGPGYRFLFVAKGAGSSNKTGFFPMTKALLEKGAFEKFLEEKIAALGVAACPPYRIALVVGGASPEQNLETLKLATTEALDSAPFFGPEGAPPGQGGPGRAWLWRDRYWEERILDIGKKTGLGAQFGGSALILDARVLRLPRHAGSCPVSIGVSCAAHRNLWGYIDEEGIHLERLVEDPGAYLKDRGIDPAAPGWEAPCSGSAGGTAAGRSIPRINLDRPMEELREDLSRFSVGDKLLLSGKVLLARDAAHLNWYRLLTEGRPLPDYLFKHPVYYAGPAATPPGKLIGSLGPTTAQRMDPYADAFMSRGASLITLAKGNRTAGWIGGCKKYGGFYLGVIGGAAALSAEKNILSNKVLDYPELGMEAVRLIEVRDLLAFIITDDKGEDLYAASR